MYSYTIVQWLFFFYLYCFGGWCVESVYVSVKSRKLTNRGFLRGPFLPLYGSGAIMMLLVSMPFRDNLFLVYVAGCIGATVLEYVTGVIMEKLFKVRYWDYSHLKFNFQGHICLGTTLSWGFLTIFLTEFLHLPVERMVLAIPGQVLTVVTLVLTALIFADLALSFKAAVDLTELLTKMSKTREELGGIQKRLDAIITSAGETIGGIPGAIAGNLDELLSSIDSKLEHIKNLASTKPSEYLESVKGELMELRTRYSVHLELRKRLGGIKDFFMRRLLRSNPSMTSERFQEDLDELKQQAGRRKEKGIGDEN